MDSRTGGLVALTSFAYSIAPSVHALGDARREVTGMLAAEGWGEADINAASLVVTELVANALMHGEPPLALSGWVDGKAFLEVVDHATDRTPARRGDGLRGKGGLGLGIVEQLTEAWGFEVRDGLKVVWCQLVRADAVDHDGRAWGDAHRPDPGPPTSS